MSQNASFRRVPWIFFDLDDTLWNFTANSAVSLRKLYEISPILRKLFKDIEEFIDIYHKHNANMWLLYSRGEVTTKELKLERWRRTLATRQFEVLTAVCEELDRNYLEILAQGNEKIPGVEKMLENLSKEVILAVLSNGFSKTQYQKLHFSGLERYITRTIVSEEIGVNKPSKRLFDYAIEETGATPPYLMVGDNPETDVVGAMKAGWHAIWANFSNSPSPFSDAYLKEQGVETGLFIGEARSIQELEKLIFGFNKKP